MSLPVSTILVTVDALRADHLGQYGYGRDTIPSLDRLCDDGTVFSQTFANGPYTRVSVPSFHTSTHLGYRDIKNLPTIASALSEADVRTCCIGTQTGFASVEGDLHFDEYVDMGRGDHYRESEPIYLQLLPKLRQTLQKVPPLYETAKRLHQHSPFETQFRFKGYTSAEDITDRAIEWLSNDAENEFFLWIHYMEGHRPYGIHEDDPVYTSPVSGDRIRELMKRAGTQPDNLTQSERQLLIDLYDSDLRYFSRHFNRLLDHLEDEEMFSDTNVIFTADHGEEFYEHGEYFHRNLPYDELLHVPLVVKTPRGPSETVDEQRELLDLAPTILNFHDVSMPESFDGRDLFQDGERDLLALGSILFDDQVVARRWNCWKYMWTEGSEYLFNLDADPGEQQNVIDDSTSIRNEFRESIPTEFLDAQPEELRDPEDEVDRQQLEALGYLEVD